MWQMYMKKYILMREKQELYHIDWIKLYFVGAEENIHQKTVLYPNKSTSAGSLTALRLTPRKSEASSEESRAPNLLMHGCQDPNTEDRVEERPERYVNVIGM